MNNIFVFFQEHFSKEMPEGVRVHFPWINAAMFSPCFQVLGKATLCDRAESPYRKNPGFTIFFSVNLRFLLNCFLEEKTSVLVTLSF